jgi:hypothetical protein
MDLLEAGRVLNSFAVSQLQHNIPLLIFTGVNNHEPK